MQAVYQPLLLLHIIAGTIALVSGGISFTVRKSKGWHTRSGSIYYYAMLFGGGSALLMCLLKFNPFLFIIGLFSLYMAISGYRSMQLRNQQASERRLTFDWLTWGICLIGLAGFLFLSRQAAMDGLTPVLWVFSLILATMLFSDFRTFRTPEALSKGSY